MAATKPEDQPGTLSVRLPKPICVVDGELPAETVKQLEANGFLVVQTKPGLRFALHYPPTPGRFT